MRKAQVERKTAETDITISLTIDGKGTSNIASDIGFFNHMLETFSKHGKFDIEAHIEGDLHVDQHHMVEDTGIVLGDAFRKALGDKKGICRMGCFTVPMDEALAMAAVDVCGRPFLNVDAQWKSQRVGDFSTELITDFFQGFTTSLAASLHIRVYYGRSDHHKIEALFKACARALQTACALDTRSNDIPSTKGIL
ncbi:MAG: imidazoleglycerol-phosphate dehydratase HisB [Candidatus Thorarchaeota archaeon]|jgi:imidazoleglycerol-phosphate dehydratase